MSEHEQIQRFGEEIDKLVDHYRAEYDLSYASIIGVFQMKSFLLCAEAAEEGEANDE